jgi:hypothetical protein
MARKLIDRDCRECSRLGCILHGTYGDNTQCKYLNAICPVGTKVPCQHFRQTKRPEGKRVYDV